MHDYLLFLLGLTPLLAMIILILKVKMPIHYSVLSTDESPNDFGKNH